MRTQLPLPRTFDLDKHDAGHLHAWLEERGIAVAGVSIVLTDDDTYEAVIDADTDPTNAVGAFTGAPTEEELLEQELDAIELETADLSDLRRSVSLMRQLMSQKKKEPRHV